MPSFPEDKKVDSCNRSNGSFTGYSLEGRIRKLYSHRSPVVITDSVYGKKILTEQWTTLHPVIINDPTGIPAGNGRLQDHGLLTKKSAYALAWTVIAQYPEEDVEVRLVPYKIKYAEESYRHEDRSEVINGEGTIETSPTGGLSGYNPNLQNI